MSAMQQGVAAMEVDRIGRMGPVTPEPAPAWTREKLRRRRFVAEVEPEVEDRPDDSEPEHQAPDQKSDFDVLA